MADTIREFLVSLGYKVDEHTEKKFTNSIRGAALQAKLLADGMEAMARNVVSAVEKVARSFDSLYWTSQRTGASIQNIRALSYAVSQLGGTYEGARQSIEAFGKHLRSNPGYGALLRQLGVRTSDRNGHMRDQVAVMEDLGKRLKSMPYYQALQYSNALGIDENTMRALMSGNLTKYLQQYADIQKKLGFDNEKAAKNSKEFMQTLRGVEQTIGAVKDKIITDLEPAVAKYLKTLSDWVVQHGPQIEETIKQIGSALKQVASDLAAVAKDLKPVWSGFDHLAKSIAGKDGLVAAIELLVGGAVLGKLIRMLGLLGGTGAGSSGLLWRLLGLFGMAAGGANAIANPGAGLKNAPRTHFGVDDALRWLWNKNPFSSSSSSSQSSAPATSKQKNEAALESYKFWRSKGLSRSAALGMVGNEEGETAFNPHARGDGGAAGGSFQWHKARRNAILAGTGIDVWSPKTTHKQMLDAAYWEMTQGSDAGARKAWTALHHVGTPKEGAAVAVHYYERPRNQAADAHKRGVYANRWAHRIPDTTNIAGGAGNKSVVMHQKTEINVVGSSDPDATATAVHRRQGSANETMLRNTTGAVR